MLPLILILAAIVLIWVVASLRSNGGTKDTPRDSSTDAAFLASFAASVPPDDDHARHPGDHHHPLASSPTPDAPGGDAAPHASSHSPDASSHSVDPGSFDAGSFDAGSHHSH